MQYLNQLGQKHSIILYHIPEDVDAKYMTQEERDTLDLIRKYFNGKGEIKWLGKKYILPGLVKEVIERTKAEGRGKAEEYVKEQAETYKEVNELLVGDKLEFEESSP